MRISHWIHNRWKIRARLLEEECIHNIPDTGGQEHQGTVDQGAMEPEIQQTVITPQRTRSEI